MKEQCLFLCSPRGGGGGYVSHRESPYATSRSPVFRRARPSPDYDALEALFMTDMLPQHMIVQGALSMVVIEGSFECSIGFSISPTVCDELFLNLFFVCSCSPMRRSRT
ncbi:hypothetical protein Droror1_Dr00023370 [Drosera rotundifolia]